MALIGTAWTMAMGETLQRHFTIIRLDRSWEVKSASLEQCEIYEKYKRHFNAIDMHNSKRQGPSSFEDPWKTQKWWLREFQMLARMSKINTLLMWRRFKQRQKMPDDTLIGRRLAYDMMYHHVRSVEREESLAFSRSRRLGILGGLEHFPILNPSGTRNIVKRLHCRYCDKKSANSCACSPFVGDGMNPRVAMAIFSDHQGDRCMLRHIAEKIPPRKRTKPMKQE